MATFTGTGGQDTFIGSTSESNAFSFNAFTLNFNDIVTGNPNAGITDFLLITTPFPVSSGSFAGVTHVEGLSLGPTGGEISLADGVVASSDQPTFKVFDGPGGN